MHSNRRTPDHYVERLGGFKLIMSALFEDERIGRTLPPSHPELRSWWHRLGQIKRDLREPALQALPTSEHYGIKRKLRA